MLDRIKAGTAVLLLALCATAAANRPIEYFFEKPEFAGFQVSPDGKSLAALAPIEGRMNLFVIDLESGGAQPVTNMTKQDVSGFMWANDERLLFFMDDDGNESFGIFAVDKDGGKGRTLVEPLASRNAMVLRATNVVHRLPDDPKHVLVTNNNRRAWEFDLFKMNIVNGRQRLVMQNPGGATGWLLDYDGEVFGVTFNTGSYSGFKVYNRKTGEFETHEKARFDEPSYTLVGIDGEDPNKGYVTSYINPDGSTRDKAAIFTYDIAKREIGDLIYEDPDYDVTNVVSSSVERRVVGVSYLAEKPVVVYTDPVWAERQAGLDAALQDSIVRVSSIDSDGDAAIVTAWSSNEPPTYYRYDVNAGKLTFLANSRPWISKDNSLVPMQPVTFEARDGLTLHGYLTMPKDAEGPVPMVLNPHGGPWARDGWGFNPEVQFLADRGYAVLQVDFRGSTGYGMSHLMAGRKQWGQAMQNDLTDAVQWAIDRGIADPDNVIIYGGSYGGYAAMAGLTFTPELYRCGVNIVGVTDLPLLFETMPDAWRGQAEQMAEMVGDPEEEAEFLRQWSPSNHADKIEAPLFMAYGRRDIRVDIKHAEKMEDALDDAGVDYDLVVYNDEGHGWSKRENIMDFYSRVDAFLDDCSKPAM